MCLERPLFVLSILSVALLQLGARLAIDDATQFSFAFVVKLLALCNSNLKLNFSLLDVNSRGYQRHSLLRRCLPKLVDLTTMQQQLSSAERIMIGTVAVRIRGNVRVE